LGAAFALTSGSGRRAWPVFDGLDVTGGPVRCASQATLRSSLGAARAM